MRTTPKMIMGAVALSAGIAMGGSIAGAQVDTYEETPPQVIDDGAAPGPVQVAGDQAVADVGGAVAAETGTAGTLPVTGGDLAGLALLGAGAVVTGSALVLHRRRAEA